MFLDRENVYLRYLNKVFVPLTHDGMKGWIFDLVCPGNALSVSNEGLLLLKNATVNRNLGFDDVCREKHVLLAYNNYKPQFEVSNITGEMVEYPVSPIVEYSLNVVHEWEIHRAFFETCNIKPIWLNANQSWGWFDNVTNTWTGATGMIERDEADYAIWGFAFTYGRSKVAAFSPSIDYLPFHWLTRYPQKLSPTLNLFGLFTKGYNSQINFINLYCISHEYEGGH